MTASSTLSSQTVDCADEQDVQDLFVQRGWSDGLPVVPPTADRVARFVEAAEQPPDHVLGEIPEQGKQLTVEKVAINAVAAGCRVEYTSVLMAAVRALTQPRFNLHSSTISGATAPLLIVSGPTVDQLSLNSSYSLFGPGYHANATIGRAIRLILQNLCGGPPGVLDKSTFGHPGKFSYCIAESPTANPWGPLHADHGIPAEQSAVTVFAGEGPVNARNDWSSEPGPILATIADAMLPSHYTGGSFVVVIGPLHAAVLAKAGLSKDDVRAELHTRAQRSTASMKRAGRRPGTVLDGDELEMHCAVGDPSDILLTVAGGNLYGYSAVIPPWVAGPDSLPVTEALHPA